MTSPARQRAFCALALLAAGVISLALAGRSGQHADAAKAIGYALLAAVGVSLLLHALGRRLVALLSVALAVGLALLTARGEGHWGLWIAAALALAGAVGQFLWAPRWAVAASRYERSAPRALRTDVDVWKAMDAGMDPTSEDFGDSLAPRETVSVADQEDQ